ncbi:MAG: hypothetical protein KatS3mg131_3656 [Candidatus Tectimicrobiota bacterium]|nr:MAG: hypothetical protein KatS3mg131_3656 [Candidatus Tectomicrobia bacterium]
MADAPQSDPRPVKAPWRLISFRLDAPAAQRVSVVGDFNGWDPHKHPLRKNPDGVWECRLSLPAGRYAYGFVVDGALQPDPHCRQRVQAPDGTVHCLLEVLPPQE